MRFVCVVQGRQSDILTRASSRTPTTRSGDHMEGVASKTLRHSLLISSLCLRSAKSVRMALTMM